MRQFNYYGHISNEMENIKEADVERLEKDIEDILKNRSATANDSQGIVNISHRNKSAGMGKRNLMSAAYRHQKYADDQMTNGEYVDDGDIYEDQEDSGDDM